MLSDYEQWQFDKLVAGLDGEAMSRRVDRVDHRLAY